MWRVDPGWMPGNDQNFSFTPLHRWTGLRKYNGVKDWERSLTKYCHRQNRLNLEILIEFIADKTRADNEKQNKLLKISSPHPSLLSSNTSSLQWHREMGNGDYDHHITHCFFHCSRRGVLPLLKHRVPSMGSSSP